MSVCTAIMVLGCSILQANTRHVALVVNAQR
jgi:hypothetical protein